MVYKHIYKNRAKHKIGFRNSIIQVICTQSTICGSPLLITCEVLLCYWCFKLLSRAVVTALLSNNRDQLGLNITFHIVYNQVLVRCWTRTLPYLSKLSCLVTIPTSLSEIHEPRYPDKPFGQTRMNSTTSSSQWRALVLFEHVIVENCDHKIWR